MSDEAKTLISHHKVANTQAKLGNWAHYPIGTKVHAINGGYWTKTERGWQWLGGDTFSTPGADWHRVERPRAEAENPNG